MQHFSKLSQLIFKPPSTRNVYAKSGMLKSHPYLAFMKDISLTFPYKDKFQSLKDSLYFRALQTQMRASSGEYGIE